MDECFLEYQLIICLIPLIEVQHIFMCLTKNENESDIFWGNGEYHFLLSRDRYVENLAQNGLVPDLHMGGGDRVC